MNKRPAKRPGHESNNTTTDKENTKRRKVEYSNVETEDITSYRRDVIDVFVSYYDRIQSVLEGNMVSFTGKAYAVQLISSLNMQFPSIFEQFKTGFELCESISEIQQRYKCFIDILLDIGGPVGDTGKEIKKTLSNLSGKWSKIYIK